MATLTKNIEEVINNVIETCRDGEQGFATAAHVIDDSSLKQDLLQYSRQRAEFATALSAAMEDLGYTPPKHGTASGAIHRGWISLINLKPGSKRHLVLTACERGEDSAVEAYNEAMDAPLPTSIAALISTQQNIVTATHNRVRSLRDAAVTS